MMTMISLSEAMVRVARHKHGEHVEMTDAVCREAFLWLYEKGFVGKDIPLAKIKKLMDA